MTTNLAHEEIWLEHMEQATLIGYYMQTADGKTVTCTDPDPGLREAIIEYQRERVRQLRLWDGTATGAGNGEPVKYHDKAVEYIIPED